MSRFYVTMFKEGTIIYFTPFYFKNGNRAKNKYFVVLKKTNDDLIIASLPTSKDHVPEKYIKPFGCVEAPEINFNCFLIPNTEVITRCGKSFPRNTFIYGRQIDDYNIECLKNTYAIKDRDYEIFGEMKEEIFNLLIKCFKGSGSIKRKYKRLL